MSSAPLAPVSMMAKKRNDKSAKIDAWVLFMAETVVKWRKHTNPDDEKLTVAEYLSEMVRKGSADEYKKAAKWMAQQTDKGPKQQPSPPDDD